NKNRESPRRRILCTGSLLVRRFATSERGFRRAFSVACSLRGEARSRTSRTTSRVRSDSRSRVHLGVIEVVKGPNPNVCKGCDTQCLLDLQNFRVRHLVLDFLHQWPPRSSALFNRGRHERWTSLD